jgi:hypothetical protein
MDTFQTDADHLTADQYKERAKIVRSTADQMTRATMRRQLLRIAEEYERLADSIERGRFGSWAAPSLASLTS